MSSVLRICDFLVCFLETLSSFARLLSINTNTHSCNHYDGRPQRTHTNTHTQTYSVCLLVLAADCRCVNQCCTQTNILTSLSFSFSASQTHTEADRVCLSVTHTHTHRQKNTHPLQTHTSRVWINTGSVVHHTGTWLHWSLRLTEW